MVLAQDLGEALGSIAPVQRLIRNFSHPASVNPMWDGEIRADETALSWAFQRGVTFGLQGYSRGAEDFEEK
jgi:hypothetical protein